MSPLFYALPSLLLWMANYLFFLCKASIRCKATKFESHEGGDTNYSKARNSELIQSLYLTLPVVKSRFEERKNRRRASLIKYNVMLNFGFLDSMIFD